MLREAVRLMCPEDFKEYCLLTRRMEFLELRASYLWRYRQAEFERAYADVSGVMLKAVKRADKEDE